jgi:hypothetical protein
MDNNWQIVCGKNKNYDSDEFLIVRPGCKFKIRLIGNPVRTVKVFSNDKKCVSVDNEDVGKQLKQKHADKISNVTVRYACWCIDRDSKTMKIVDMPKTVARAFGIRAEMVGNKMSGKEGCDWVIGTNGMKGKNVKYNVVYVQETPLTQTEQEMVEKRKANKERQFDLTKVFKSCCFEEAEEKLLGANSAK